MKAILQHPNSLSTGLSKLQAAFPHCFNNIDQTNWQSDPWRKNKYHTEYYYNQLFKALAEHKCRCSSFLPFGEESEQCSQFSITFHLSPYNEINFQPTGQFSTEVTK